MDVLKNVLDLLKIEFDQCLLEALVLLKMPPQISETNPIDLSFFIRPFPEFCCGFPRKTSKYA